MKESKEVREFYSEKYNEKVVLHRWAHSTDSSLFSISEDYYLIRDQKVYAIQEFGTEHALYPTGDNVSDSERCIEIGDYDEQKHKDGEYKKRVRYFKAEELEPVLKENYRDF